MPDCLFCREPVVAGDRVFRFANGPVAHYACSLRQVIGSVAHQQHRCGCWVVGSTAGDEPHLSRREAAVAALAYFYGDGGVHDAR